MTRLVTHGVDGGVCAQFAYKNVSGAGRLHASGNGVAAVFNGDGAVIADSSF